MELRCEIHAPVALPLREETLVPTKLDTDVSQSVRLFLLVQWIELTDHPVCGIATILTELPKLLPKSKINNPDNSGYYIKNKWHSCGATRKTDIILWTALFWVVTQRVVVFLTDVSGQPTGLIHQVSSIHYLGASTRFWTRSGPMFAGTDGFLSSRTR